MTWFSNIPFLRILIPFVIGLLLALHFDLYTLSALSTFMILAGLLFALYFLFRQKRKLLFLITADLFLFLYGFSLLQFKNSQHNASYYGHQINTDSLVEMIAVINDLPVEKKQFIKLQLNVKEVKTKGKFNTVDGKILAYVRKSKSSAELQAGKTILLKCRLLEVEPPKNPSEFDYHKYLYNRQIYHTAFVDSGAFAVIESVDQINGLWKFALLCKQSVIQRLKFVGLSKEAFSICSALLTGYDEEIDQSVLQAFAHSGTLHILSVSGLHTGLLYALLSFLFDLFDRKRRYKLFKFLLITLILWSFAMITGFSAPVLRAVIMFNLFGLGKIYFRQDYRNQLNILFVSAFGLLNVNPYLITDIGFLLSYSALFGLIYFEPKFSGLWQPEHKISLWLWKSLSTSFAATISTLPFTLYYFKQFPYWFFVANLVVIPGSFLILMLALFVLFNPAWLVSLINVLVSALIGFIHVFDSDRFGYLDKINFEALDVFWITLLLIFLSLAFQKRSYRFCQLSLLSLLFWLLTALIQTYLLQSKSLFTVYDLKRQSALSLKQGSDITYQISDASQFDYKIKPHFIALNQPNPHQEDFNYFYYKGYQMLSLNSPQHWPEKDLKDIRLLILSNNFVLRESEFKQFKGIETLVMDYSNTTKSIQQMEKLCRKFGIAFYYTHREGAFLLALNEIKNRR